MRVGFSPPGYFRSKKLRTPGLPPHNGGWDGTLSEQDGSSPQGTGAVGVRALQGRLRFGDGGEGEDALLPPLQTVLEGHGMDRGGEEVSQADAVGDGGGGDVLHG